MRLTAELENLANPGHHPACHLLLLRYAGSKLCKYDLDSSLSFTSFNGCVISKQLYIQDWKLPCSWSFSSSEKYIALIWVLLCSRHLFFFFFGRLYGDIFVTVITVVRHPEMNCVQTYKVFLTLCMAFILDFTASVKEDKQGRRTAICLRSWYQFSVIIGMLQMYCSMYQQQNWIW